jgi:hypothetical protein
MTHLGVGSVVEMVCGDVCVYALCIYEDRTYGLLWRIVDETTRSRPTDLESFVRRPERFFVFSPLDALVSRAGPFRDAGRVTVFPDVAAVPQLRWPIYRPGSSEVSRWKLWTTSSPPAAFPMAGPEHEHLSILEVAHPDALRRRIEEGWRPRDRPVRPEPDRNVRPKN